MTPSYPSFNHIRALGDFQAGSSFGAFSPSSLPCHLMDKAETDWLAALLHWVDLIAKTVEKDTRL
jgi:hypothetical protein